MNNLLIGLIAVTLLIGGGALFMSHHDHDHHGHAHDKHGHDHHDKHDEHYELVAKAPVREDGTFSIATSFYPLEFALSRIAGDLAEVTNVGAGRDPHDFRPSTQDILAMQQADLVVIQGAEFEPWGDEVKEQLRAEDVPVVVATAELELMKLEDDHGDHHDEHGEEAEEEHKDEEEHHDEHEEEHDDHHDHAHGEYDPHTWLSPALMSEKVEHFAEALATLDPENTATYEANAAALQAELTALDTEYETALSSCSTDEIITSHDAFGYLAEQYNFTIHSIAGISTQDTPSAQTLANLKEEAEEGVNAILLENSSVTAFGETLAAETGLQTLPVNPIAYVVPEGQDYFSLMRANLESFQTALVCNG